jgi:hypothetical protein
MRRVVPDLVGEVTDRRFVTPSFRRATISSANPQLKGGRNQTRTVLVAVGLSTGLCECPSQI